MNTGAAGYWILMIKLKNELKDFQGLNVQEKTRRDFLLNKTVEISSKIKRDCTGYNYPKISLRK